MWAGLPDGASICEVKGLFPRLNKTKIMDQIKGSSASIEDAGQKSDNSTVSERPGERGSSPAVREGSEGSGQHATEADAIPSPATGALSLAHGGGRVSVEADAVQNRTGDGLIEITDFAKIDLRVGEVRSAERIPKADKLLLLTVDIGEEKPRQILAGIAQYYTPEQLVGRKIVVVANLKPRRLRGHESQGMLLAASVGEEGKPVIATFAEDVPNGARLK
jgi:methionyl-tRNA synthetase